MYVHTDIGLLRSLLGLVVKPEVSSPAVIHQPNCSKNDNGRTAVHHHLHTLVIERRVVYSTNS
jgi:hypothetical protein